MLKEKYRKNIYNFQQLPYDHREWDYNSWTWTGRFNQRSNSPDLDKPVPILLYNLPYNGNIDFGNTDKHGTKEHDLIDIDLEEHVLKLFSLDIPKEVLYRQNAKLRAEKHCRYYKGDKCKKCSIEPICDGLHNDYNIIFGDEEINPIIYDKPIEDPTYYIKNQNKITDEDIL